MRITKRRAMKTFLALTAADLMSAPVTSIPHDMLLRDAGHLLVRSSITGAPVVDSEGNCIGILSSSDFAGWAQTGGEMEEKRKAVGFIAPWGEIVNLDACEGCVVSRYMTKGPVTVSLTTPIGEIAQMMIDAHIHRVLVADQNRPCGIVSSTDIMAAVASANRYASHESKG
jgi:CBS domain-containing protein